MKKTKIGVVYPSVAKSIGMLGESIATARRARRISTQDFAERMGVSRMTLHRLENGDPGCSIHTIASALHVLGMLEQLTLLANVGRDMTALAIMQSDLPQRIRRKNTVTSKNSFTSTNPELVGW